MIAKAVTLAAVAAVGLAPTASADDVQRYLDLLHQRGISAGSGDGTMVQVGTIKVAGANEVKGRLNGNIMSVQVMNGEDNSTITTDNPREMQRHGHAA